MDDILKLISLLRAQYDRIYEHAGVDVDLDKQRAENTPFYSLVKEDDDEYMLRVQGPMDPFWGGCNVPELIAALDKEKPKSLRVLVESPGGLVSYGLSLFNDLARRKKEGMSLRTEAAGIVASAAVLPFLAADKDSRSMTEGSLLMVHEVWGGFFFAGEADDLEKESAKTVRAIRTLTKTYAGIVQKATGMKAADVASAMSEETWYSADMAVKSGYAAIVAESKPVTDPAEQARAEQSARAALSQFILQKGSFEHAA